MLTSQATAGSGRIEFAPTGGPVIATIRPETVHYGNLDVLRLFLAIEVVALHLWAGLMRPGSLWVPVPPVAAFVALSGFLIPQSLDRSRDLKHFARKRVLRTLPALGPLMVFIALVFGGKAVLGAVSQYLTAGYVGQFVGVTLPLWSLIVEDVLYAVMAACFLGGLHQKWQATLAVTTALLIGDRFIADSMFRYRIFDTSIAFFTGHAFYLCRNHLQRVHWMAPAAVAAAASVGMFDFLGRLAFPLHVGSVVLLATTLPQIRWKLPDLSYGIYIWHAPIMLGLLGPAGMPRDASWVVVTSVLTLGASLASWYLVEKPALRLKSRGTAESPRTIPYQVDEVRSEGRLAA